VRPSAVRVPGARPAFRGWWPNDIAIQGGNEKNREWARVPHFITGVCRPLFFPLRLLFSPGQCPGLSRISSAKRSPTCPIKSCIRPPRRRADLADPGGKPSFSPPQRQTENIFPKGGRSALSEWNSLPSIVRRKGLKNTPFSNKQQALSIQFHR